MSLFELFWPIVIIINILVTFFVVFREPREISATWAWLLVLLLLPVVGVMIYLLFGKKISQDNIFDLKKQKQLGLKPLHKEQQQLMREGHLLQREDELQYPALTRELITLFLNSDKAVYSNDNHIQLILDGEEKFATLFDDIRQATRYIHIAYYIINPDEIGTQLRDLLIEKARAGVEVLVLFDALGSRKLNNEFLQPLTEAGGVVERFFGSDIPMINIRLNYRNHRKIVIVDGLIAYTGGFNVGDEYLGRGPLGEWRDTHLRITGSAVWDLQTRFLMDWNATASSEHMRQFKDNYFPHPQEAGTSGIQIVSSGPDSELDQIKQGILRMIYGAKESIYIQTPYLIFDESFFDALQIAAMSGVNVHIMMPSKPDHPVVYRASEYYAKTIAAFGVHIHIFQRGFLHAKTIVVDGKVASVGTANFDIRSFKLNFEVNTFIYDHRIVAEIQRSFEQDLQHCVTGDTQYFQSQSLWRKFKQSFSRLFSPIL